MIRYLLKELERSQSPLFSKRELLSISRSGFESLRKKQILHYVRPSQGAVEKLRMPRCPYGCHLTVMETRGKLEAVCLNHPEEDPIQIDKDDLNRYAFSLDKFLFLVRSANDIEGEFQRISGGYFRIGYKLYGKTRVGFCFVHVVQDDCLIKLTGLKDLVNEDDILVVLTPYSLISDLVLKNALQSKRIVQMALAEYLNTKTFVSPLKKNLSSILQSLATEKSEIFEITEAQDKDYQQHKYLCHDRLHISGETTEKGKNLINLNDNEVTIEEANFILLLRLIVELKNNKEGLVDQHTLHKEGIISDPERFQHFSRLRKELEANLIGKNGIEFIQNIPKKGYRISTHPDFVTYDKDKLLKLENYRIVEIAERFP